MGLPGYLDGYTRAGAPPEAPVAVEAVSSSIEIPVCRNLDGYARLVGSVKATFTRPIAPAVIQESVHRYNDFGASAVGFSMPSIALPTTSVGVHRISVRRYLDCNA
jgi:hypothetical protein